jgi:hypothetical protein
LSLSESHMLFPMSLGVVYFLIPPLGLTLCWEDFCVLCSLLSLGAQHSAWHVADV